MMYADEDYKQKLIKKIEKINNKDIIDECYRLLDMDIDETVYATNKDQKESINEARDQIKKGNVLSEKEANEEVDKWLNK